MRRRLLTISVMRFGEMPIAFPIDSATAHILLRILPSAFRQASQEQTLSCHCHLLSMIINHSNFIGITIDPFKITRH